MDESIRQSVLAQQKQLVHALVNAPADAADAGFDVKRLELAARMLRAKRFRAARRASPRLFRRLGARGFQEFNGYAKMTPLPRGGAMADAIAFARHARRRPELPLAVRWWLLIAGIARWRSTAANHGDEGA